MRRDRSRLFSFAGFEPRIVLTFVLATSLAAKAQSGTVGGDLGCGPANQFAGLTTPQVADGVALTSQLERSIQITSFRELNGLDLLVRTFHSESDYLRTRFSIPRFFLPLRMRYYVDVNPALFQQHAPDDGLCAILAHELAHIVVLSRGNRIRRFGLIRLLSKGRTAVFERRADLDAIHRGYGNGLRSYRSWLYTHIPPKKVPGKLRNYLSPEEISLIESKLQEQLDLFSYWSRHVPMTLKELQSAPAARQSADTR